MTSLAFIHTVPALAPIFESELGTRIQDSCQSLHIVDTGFDSRHLATGASEYRRSCLDRLNAHIEYAAANKADAVLVTCTTLGPLVDEAKEISSVPVVRIDEAMADTAALSGERILVLATSPWNFPTSVEIVKRSVARCSRGATVVGHLCEGAFLALAEGNREGHDAAVLSALSQQQTTEACDVVVLAQASMAHLVERARDVCGPGVSVLASPPIAIENLLEGLIGQGRS